MRTRLVAPVPALAVVLAPAHGARPAAAAPPAAREVANAAGSHEPRAQIEPGAAADTFASADLRHMEAQRAARLAAEPVPKALNVVAQYPIAVLVAAPAPDFARAWMPPVRSPAGQAVPAELGFTACPRE